MKPTIYIPSALARLLLTPLETSPSTPTCATSGSAERSSARQEDSAWPYRPSDIVLRAAA